MYGNKEWHFQKDFLGNRSTLRKIMYKISDGESYEWKYTPIVLFIFYLYIFEK